jgi:hypothetical protein
MKTSATLMIESTTVDADEVRITRHCSEAHAYQANLPLCRSATRYSITGLDTAYSEPLFGLAATHLPVPRTRQKGRARITH